MRQRGTQFHPGQHVSHIALFGSKALITSPCAMQVGMGRDHTLFALVPGYVRFYKETRMRGERKRSVSATRMDVRLVFAREQCVSIACDHVRNSRALSHPRIVFFDKLHVGCVSMRVPLPNPRIERASVVNAQAHNDVSCRKPA